MKHTERSQALRILLKVFTGTPLSHLLNTTQDVSPFCKELCFGISRHYIRLQTLADCLVKKRPKPKDLDVWLSILMGLYQLHYLGVADYAVVKETVTLLDYINKPWAKGLVNAVLRTYCREQESLMQQVQDNDAFIYGHPSWLIERIARDWPNDWKNILLANDTHPPMSLRVNAQQRSRNEYLARLQQANLNATVHPYATEGLVLTTPVNVYDLPGFSDGEVSVQDTAAQLAVSLLQLKPGLRVLDACAAPGGKTCHILETQVNLAATIALDIESSRLKRVLDNLNRLHLQATLIEGDGLHPETWWDGLLFDRILLDAPCSATGVIRRHPDIKRLRTQEEITQVAVTQFALLNTLWKLLAPQGILVYATCSIMPEENEHQIARFIKQQPDAELFPMEAPWGRQTGHGLQILPGNQDMDGFFYSILQKKGR